MSSESPVLDTLADMTAASVDHNSLSPREYMLARLAALIAMDAPPLSYVRERRRHRGKRHHHR